MSKIFDTKGIFSHLSQNNLLNIVNNLDSKSATDLDAQTISTLAEGLSSNADGANLLSLLINLANTNLLERVLKQANLPSLQLIFPNGSLGFSGPSIKIYNNILNYFNQEELRTLTFKLGIDYDDLPAVGRANKARELVRSFAAMNQLPRLVTKLHEERPKIDWKKFLYEEESSVKETTIDFSHRIKAISQLNSQEQLIYQLAQLVIDKLELSTVISQTMRKNITEIEIDSLISQLGASDPNQRQFAMQYLHVLGNRVTHKLMLARHDPSLRDSANKLLISLHAGQTFRTEEPTGIKADLFKTTPHLDQISNSIAKLLINPHTNLNTLNSLMDSGFQSVPILCEILLRPT